VADSGDLLILWIIQKRMGIRNTAKFQNNTPLGMPCTFHVLYVASPSKVFTMVLFDERGSQP
jgi:hypothetical protein